MWSAVDPRAEQAARTLGAGPVRAFLTATAPAEADVDPRDPYRRLENFLDAGSVDVIAEVVQRELMGWL